MKSKQPSSSSVFKTWGKLSQLLHYFVLVIWLHSSHTTYKIAIYYTQKCMLLLLNSVKEGTKGCLWQQLNKSWPQWRKEKKLPTILNMTIIPPWILTIFFPVFSFLLHIYFGNHSARSHHMSCISINQCFLTSNP